MKKTILTKKQVATEKVNPPKKEDNLRSSSKSIVPELRPSTAVIPSRFNQKRGTVDVQEIQDLKPSQKRLLLYQSYT
jgi:hypothetical protein